MIHCSEFSLASYFDLTLFFSFLLLLGCYIIYRILRIIYINKYYKKHVNRVLLERKKEIDNFLQKYSESVPEPMQKEILLLTACELLDKIKSKQITSEQVLITYALRAATIGLDYGLIADTNFEDAIFEARIKDKMISSTEATEDLPPLYGLPMSIKDHITTKNLRYTAGFMKTALLEKSPDDCNFAKVLRDSGAIFYVSSNLPQGIGSIESCNGFWGRALNPWDKTKTPGGSSGGEAGLIASKCSPLGIGSDAAGSIRIPCSFCGIYGFAPTGKRVSLKKTRNIRIHDLNVYREINCTYGPMGKSVDDLVLIMKCLYGKFTGMDPDVPPLKWDQIKYEATLQKKLRIGVVYDDPFCESFPAIRNVIQEVVTYLKQNGHEIVKVEENWTEEFLLTGMPVMQAHGMATNIEKTLAGELPESYYRLQVFLSYFPRIVLKFFGFMSKFVGEERFGKLLGILYDRDLEEYYQEVYKKELLKDRFADFWLNNKLDALITPILPYPAIRHGDAEILQGLIASTFIYNIMGMPAGVVPIRNIKANEEYYTTKYQDMAARKLKSMMKEIKGLPVGVQIASWNYDDETCLGLMKQIENEFKYHEYPVIK